MHLNQKRDSSNRSTPLYTPAWNGLQVINNPVLTFSDSDEKEFEEDPLLQVLRKQRAWIKEQIENAIVKKVIWIPSKEMTVDTFTYEKKKNNHLDKTKRKHVPSRLAFIVCPHRRQELGKLCTK